MKKVFSEKIFCYIFHFISILMFFVLFHYCLCLTGENSGPAWDEHIYFKTDSIVFNGCLIGLCLAAFCFIGKLAEKLKIQKTRRSRNLLLGIVCVLSAAISFYWVFAGKIEPQGDQMFVCQYADAFNVGDFRGLLTGRYIARYPQQIGMVTLLRGLFKIFGQTNYLAFQYLVAAMVPLFIVSGCQIVRLLSEDNVKAELYYLFFALCCFPMYAYTTFVYGDLISTILGMFGVWMYLSCLKRFSWVRLVLFGLSIGIAVQLRKNLLILVIALAIVLLIKLCFDCNWKNLALVAALVLGWGMVQMAVWGLYYDAKTENAPAIPAILFIVMGLNDDYQHPGWHNQYEYHVFATLDDNLELAREKGYEDLKMYLELYKNDPDYMVDFFVRKMNAQWNAPMYQSVVMNNHVVGEQGPLIKNIFEGGKLAEILQAGMKLYQLLMYGGILFLLIIRRKEYVHIEKYLLLVAVFGGFLFSLMWEAKTRYILPYFLMQIPYMAMGVEAAVSALENKVLKGSK